MKIILFSGALRKGSLNRKLAAYAKTVIMSESKIETELIDLVDYDLPVYSGDIEDKGIPEGVKKLGEKLDSANAFVVSTPEYNGSIPGSLKNAIDWVSRLRPVPLNNKKNLLLLGASPGAMGAIRSLWHTRIPFEVLGVHVYPTMFGLGKANEAFDDVGKLKEAKLNEQFTSLIKNFLAVVSKAHAN